MDTSPSPSAAISSTDDPVAKPTPFDLAAITITRREHVELKTAAAHYKRLHGDATKRIESVLNNSSNPVFMRVSKHFMVSINASF